MANLSLESLIEGNFFNFLLLFLLFVFLALRVDLAGMINSAKEAVIDLIKQSENKKAESEKSLEIIKKEVQNLPNELALIIKDAENTVEGYKNKTIEEIKANEERIEHNAKKIMENEVQKVSSVLRKELSYDSLSAAEAKIVYSLSQNKDLHRKFISDAIDKIEELNI